MLSQVLNGVVLPFVLVFMLLLINKKELMGEYVNTRLFNVVAWADHGNHDRLAGIFGRSVMGWMILRLSHQG